MSNQLNVSVIASLFNAVIGRIVIAEGKDGAADTRYKIASLSDKTGTLKDGTKGEYVVLQREDDATIVVNVHPNSAKKLFTKGEDAGLKMLEALPTSETEVNVADETAQVETAQVETAQVETAQAAEVVAEPEVNMIEASAQRLLDVLAQNLGLGTEQTTEVAGETTVTETAPEQAAAPVDTPVVEKTATEGNGAEPAAEVKEPTKKERAIVIVNAGLAAGKARKDIIAQLRTELTMGVPGASTYFQNVKSGAWK